MEAASSTEPGIGLLDPGAAEDDEDEGDGEEIFGTETMAELCARQGRLGEAIAIYRRLIAGEPPADRQARWSDRLAALERARARAGEPESPAAPSAPARPTAPAAVSAPAAGPAAPASGEMAPAARPTARKAGEPAPAAPAAPAFRPALVVRQPVRSGQIVRAEKGDLVVLAPVNPGGRVVADGHIHAYAPLRGTVIAGAAGSPEARIFCQRLEAELLAVCGVYLTAEEIPPALFGRAVEIALVDGRCVLTPLA
jgi:septum site-determining protein MinC